MAARERKWGSKEKGKRKTFRYGRMRLAERLQPLTYGRDKRDFFSRSYLMRSFLYVPSALQTP